MSNYFNSLQVIVPVLKKMLLKEYGSKEEIEQ